MQAVQTFPADAVSVAAARRFVAKALASIPGAARDAAVLMISEVATNAVLHARSAFTVTIQQTGHETRLEVRDHGPGTPTPRSPGPDEASGRGLQIVDTFARSWGVDVHAGDGKTVWFTLTRG